LITSCPGFRFAHPGYSIALTDNAHDTLPIKPLISSHDLNKFDIRVGTIVAIEDVPNSAKLVRNTRYQADATPYLGRTFTGWIAPACGWRSR
jgi:hypothetical protein